MLREGFSRGFRGGFKRERVVACLLSPSECGTDSVARLRLRLVLLPVPPTCHSRHCPVGIATCLWLWPGWLWLWVWLWVWLWPGRFAALREIGYQSFCNLVCNLKFMKHIPLTQKMQANVCEQPCSSLAGSSSSSPTHPLLLTLPAHCRLKLPFALFICLH